MKVRDLIEALQELDPELEVVLQKDDEGNGYRRMHGVDDDAFVFTEELADYNIEGVYAELDLQSEFEEEDREEFDRVAVLY